MPRPVALRMFLPFGVALLVAAVEFQLLFPMPAVADNFLFWAIGHLVLSGASPYDNSAFASIASYGLVPGGIAVNTASVNVAFSHQNQVWLYPPQTAFLFAPFGALPFELGVPLWRAFVFISAFVAIAMLAWRAGLRGTRLAFALTLAIVSQPFVIAVRNGHPIGLLIIGGALLLDGRGGPRTAVGTALLTLKPHIVAVLALFAVGRAVARRDARSLLVMVAAALAITLPAELRTPFPFDTLLDASFRFGLDLTTIPALARDLGGGVALTVILTALLVAACALAVLWSTASRRSEFIGACLFILSVGLVPYVHDYDLFLAMPALFVGLASGVGRPRELATSLIVAIAALLPWLFFFWWPLAGEPDRYYQGGMLGAVPIVFAFALAACAFLTRETRSRRVRPEREPHAPAG